MAAPTPRAKMRQNAYTDIGVQGRKTGVTLREQARDEHGMELVDGMFSSPEKTISRSAKSRSGAATAESDEMDLENTSGPGPREILTGRSIKPAPRSRSPIKSMVTSSPMRPRFSSVGLQSSPSKRPPAPIPNLRRPNGGRASLFQTDSSPNGALDYDPFAPSAEMSAHQRTHHRLGQSPQRPTVTASGPRKRSQLAAASPKVEKTLSSGLNKRRRGGLMSSQPTRQSFGNAFRANEEEAYSINEDTVPDEGDASTLGPGGDGILTIGSPRAPTPEHPSRAAGKGKGRNRKQPLKTIAQSASIKIMEKGKGKASRGKTSRHAAASLPEKQGEAVEESSVGGGNQELAEEVELPPKKRARTTNAASKFAPADATGGAGKGKSRTLNSKKQAAKPERPTAGKLGSGSAEAGGRGYGSHVVVSRHEASQEPETRATRSGRNVIKPLAFWKGETVEYADRRKSKGGTFIQGGIKEIVRADEIVDDSRSGARRARLTRRKKTKVTIQESSDESESEMDEWEKEDGFLAGEVLLWDEELCALSADVNGDVHVELNEALAYAGDAIETQAVDNCEFRMVKTVTEPFFGAGLIDLPPGTVKQVKDPGPVYLAFYVATGRVTVTVNEDRFSIGKGGIFHVPRGNLYGIENHKQRPARLFFAQGNNLTLEQREEVKARQKADQERMASALSSFNNTHITGSHGEEESAVNGTYESIEGGRSREMSY